MTDHADIQAPGLQLGEAPPRIPITVEGALAAAAMAVLAVITMANVAMRYLTDISIAFTEEYSVAIMVVMTFLGSAAAFGADRHIRVTYFTEKLPLRTARMVEIFVLLCGLFVFGALAWFGAFYTWDEYRFEVLSPGLGVPQWLYTGWMPLMSLVICARLLGRMIRVARA
ncbi:TRAP transporter small permease [Pararoseomonas indoligenes]|uniref:TRAP transporter small permease protein n=1 Tax=Roseomonas indoligenes TaxID=2820811 RepID=A0A940S3Q4_9PROT|nr:TRAP transporter small permease [Pararoseomonas indoligenes]MBP0491215.1 TRAP transporter small permease [Pararoseomonas indoligenes]